MSPETSKCMAIILYQLLPALFLVLCLVLGIGCRKRIRSELHAPLLPDDMVEHRVDAATRDAALGFIECAGCAFENFTRFTHCARCGDALPQTHASARRAAMGSRRHDYSNHHSKYTAAVQPKQQSPPPIAQPKQLTPQQVRVRRRREWVRRLGVDGHAFWFRSAVSNAQVPLGQDVQALSAVDTVQALAPGYVASFQHASSASPPAARLSEGGEIPMLQAPNSVEPVAATGSDRGIDDAVTLELVPAAQADAAQSSTGCRIQGDSTTRTLQHTLRLAAKDFPTKYAHFVVSTASLIVPAEVEFLKLSVHREFLLEESVDHLSCIQQANIRSFMRITFLDESGVDAGGVHREWFMLVNEMLLAPALRLFVCTNKSEQAFYLNPHSAHDVGEDHLTYYFSTGRLVGRALLEGGVWGFHLALPLIKIILGIPVTFSDLEYLDPEAYRSMVWLLEHSDVDALGLDFSVTEQRSDGHVVVVDLIPNGRDVAVTDANKREYLDRKMRYLLFESVSSQLYVFLKGLYEVIPQELLMLFDAEEFDYLLCGTQEIDVDDWRANTVISANLMLPMTLSWFWEVVREMPNEYRRRLLLFATGSSRVPLSGFAGLTSYDGRLCPFTLKGVPYTTSTYISSHACFNRLELPLYRSKRELKTVLLATLETDQYGFTTA